MKLARFSLIAYGLMFLYFGVLLYIKPTAIGNTVPLQFSGPAAVTEIRAFYGGMEIGLGAWFVAAGVLASLRRPGLWLLLALSAGLTLGRITGILVDHAAGGFIFIALAVESGGVILSAVALRLTRRASGRFSTM